MTFFNVRSKQLVDIDDAKCVKHKYEKKMKSGAVRCTYAVSAADVDGTRLAKFIKKELFDTLKCPVG